jgi:type II secretion system protein H
MKRLSFRFRFRGRPASLRAGAGVRQPRGRAFTLIELMIVIAIMGLIAAMGLPSLLKAMQKEGMRKALSDIQDCCNEARTRAILYQTPVGVRFQAHTHAYSVAGGSAVHDSPYVKSAELPEGVSMDLLFINWLDYGDSDEASTVWFYPNGTSDEMKIELSDKTQRRMMTLEFATGSITVSDVLK